MIPLQTFRIIIDILQCSPSVARWNLTRPSLPLLPCHFQKKQICDLLCVIHECQAIVSEHVSEAPDLLNKGATFLIQGQNTLELCCLGLRCETLRPLLWPASKTLRSGRGELGVKIY